MSFKGVALSMLMFFALQQFAISADAAAATENDELQVEIQIPPRLAVGSRNAGLLCLPNGRFLIEDFYPSSSYLKALIVGARDEIGDSRRETKAEILRLKSLKVSLCARDYLSAKGRFSGPVTATFEVASSEEPARLETVQIRIEKEQAKSEAEIAQTLVSSLIHQMAAQP